MVKVPRSAVQAITFLSKNFSVLYDPSMNTNGWKLIHNASNSWSYRDGTFICNGPGAIWRNLGLTGSSSVEFDMAWGASFQIGICIYTDHELLDMRSDSYLVVLSAENVELRRLETTNAPLSLGQASLPKPASKRKLHLTIHVNKEESTVTIFANHRLIKRWTDPAGFAGKGSGIAISPMSGIYLINQQVGPPIRISNLEISQWEGRLEPEVGSPSLTNADQVSLVNHDRATGRVEGVKEDKLHLLVGERRLAVPLERVTQIDLAGPTNTAVPAHSSSEVRAQFSGAGTLSFDLEKLDSQTVSGRSAVFGPLSFQAKTIRQLEFNLDRSKEEPAAADEEFGGLDE
jgi:hypothetical protein